MTMDFMEPAFVIPSDTKSVINYLDRYANDWEIVLRFLNLVAIAQRLDFDYEAIEKEMREKYE